MCAHILDIVLFNEFDIADHCSTKNYILSHKRFESPQYIFDNDHVSLITIDEENAIFGVAKQKGMHLWKFEHGSFIRDAQVLHCKQLILVPLNHFHRMAVELGDPKGQLIFLFHTSRCGSTLVSQMMQTTGKCISISEPESINAMARWYKCKGDSLEFRQLCQDVVRWTCRPYQNITPLAYMVKVMPLYNYILPVFGEIFPCSKCLFMYRDVIKVAQSFYRFSRALPSLVLLDTVTKLSPRFDEEYLDWVSSLGKKFIYKFSDDLSLGVIFVTVNCKLYSEFRLNGLKVSALRYEDIVKDKHLAAKAILKFCGLPMSLEQDFLHGLEFDSQQNSDFSQMLLAKHREPPLTLETERLVNEVLKENGLPIIGDDWLLEGTITYGNYQ